MKKFLLLCLLVGSPLLAGDKDPDLKQFAGHWDVIQLVENGQVILREAIGEWLPSGGRAEIADNAIIFRSSQGGK